MKPVARRWALAVARSIIAGAASGAVAGWLLFFVFGFAGLEGGTLVERARHGWRAANALGPQQGLAVGIAVALGVTLAAALWVAITGRFRPRGARPWLAATAGLVIVATNTSSLRHAGSWDPAGSATVAGMALLVAGAVWLASPWVLNPLDRN